MVANRLISVVTLALASGIACATATSRFLSLSKSPVTRPYGVAATVKVVVPAVLNVALLLPISSDRLALPLFATTRSAIPSLLISITPTDCGKVPTMVVVLTGAAKSPAAAPKQTLTLLLLLFGVMMSLKVSPLTSPTVTLNG